LSTTVFEFLGGGFGLKERSNQEGEKSPSTEPKLADAQGTKICQLLPPCGGRLPSEEEGNRDKKGARRTGKRKISQKPEEKREKKKNRAGLER